MNKIRNSLDEKQSQSARQTVNVRSGRKSTSRTKLPAKKKDSRNLLGIYPEITNNTSKQTTNGQLDV